MTTIKERFALARLSLEGLSVGDALGGFFEMSSPTQLSHFITERVPPAGIWHFTDDTNMALSIYAVLRMHEHIDQDGNFDHTHTYGEKA